MVRGSMDGKWESCESEIKVLHSIFIEGTVEALLPMLDNEKRP